MNDIVITELQLFSIYIYYWSMIDHHSYKRTTYAVVKLKPEKKSGLNGIRTHDLCDTGAVFYQLSYQASWKVVSL